MTAATECPTQFLDEDNEPDLLDPQLRAARSLQHLIESSDGGRVVSLEGRFGSGKTSIIRHLRAYYDAQKPRRTHVLIFDTWAHRGEALRRSFVTKVHQLFIGQGLLTADQGERVEQAMTRKPDVALAKMRPQFQLIAGLLGGLSILLGVVRVLSLLAGRPTVEIDPMLAFILGGLLLGGGWFLGRTTTETVTHKGADLTSLEFEAAFVVAVSTALRENKTARLVFVLDDLDRLGGDDIEEVVTLLRIFFQAKQQVEGVERLWFVIPFDRQQLSKNVDTGIAGDAMQKLFARRIDGPPPNLPATASVFHERFIRAFPKHTQLEAYEIHSMLVEREGSVTLRRVHWFLNRIASLHATWCGQIPLVDIAAYALIRDAMKDDDKYEEKARPGGAVDEAAWRKHFAALYFNVLPDQTVFAVHANEIEAAMLSGNGERLHTLVDTPGFESVALQILTNKSEQLSTTPEHLMNAASAFALLVSNDKLAPVWQNLIHAALRVATWPRGADLRGLAILLRQANTSERRSLATAAFRSLQNGLQLTSDSPPAEIDQWFDNFNRIVDAADADAPLDALDQLAGSPRFRLEVLRAIAEGRFRYPHTPPIYLGDDAELRNFLLDMAASNSFDANRAAIAEMVRLGVQWNWSDTLERGQGMMARASVMTAGHLAIGQIMELFVMIERLALRPEATTKLDSYAELGTFLHFAIHAWGAQGPTVSVLLACLAMRPLERVGNKVQVVTERDILQTNAEKVLAFLRHPSDFLAIAVGDVLQRLGFNDTPAQRLPRIAAMIDERGGIEFDAVFPSEERLAP